MTDDVKTKKEPLLDSDNCIVLEGKRVKVNPAPATIGYEQSLKYMGSVKFGVIDEKKMSEVFYTLIKYAELELPDGRSVKLDNKEILNQHFNAASMMTLQLACIEANFGFLAEKSPLGS